MKVSTGLRNALLDAGSLASQMDLGFIKIYAGPVPASADAALGSATLLCTISNNSTGTGLKFETAAADGSLPKESTEVWSGVNAAGGTATFFRHVAATGDDGTLSTTQKRIQGTIGASGADLNLSSVNLSNGATQTIDYYSVTLPTL